MEIKNIQSDQDFQKVMDSVNKYIDTINKYQEGNPHLVQPTAMELAQFHKSHFYHNWLHRYRRLFAFAPLGNHGVIAVPNTTFEEWLYWFSEWAEAFMDDYNAFKKLVFEALLLIEKHLEAIDAELENHEGRITANEAHLADHDAQLANHQKHLEDLDKGLADETKARQDADNAEKNARISKDNDLQNQINQEKGAREQKDNDLQNQINQEKGAREQKDNDLQNQINAEKGAREQADNDLSNRITNNTRAISNIAKLSVKVGYDHRLDLTDAMISNGWSKTQYYEDTSYGEFNYSFIDTDGDNVANYLMYNFGVNNMHKHVNETKPGGFWGAVSDPNYRERYGNVVVSVRDSLLNPVIDWLASDKNSYTKLNGQPINRIINWGTPINNANGAPNGTDGWYLLPAINANSQLTFILTRAGGFPSDFNNNDGIEFQFSNMTYSERQYLDISSLNLSMEGR